MDTEPSTLELALDAPAVFHAPSCSPLRVLVACEYSGAVRDAFRALGHDAMSCDLLPTDADGPHYCGDVRDLLDYPWDIMIAHPPCTHLSVSGAKHFEAKRMDGRQQSAVSFFMMLARSPIPKIAIENPVCIMSSMWRKPDQVIQPWQFGHGETKATCLWLKGLPKLQPTNIVEGREQRIFKMPPSADRWKERSKTFAGIAAAMAHQWGGFRQANWEGHPAQHAIFSPHEWGSGAESRTAKLAASGRKSSPQGAVPAGTLTTKASALEIPGQGSPCNLNSAAAESEPTILQEAARC